MRLALGKSLSLHLALAALLGGLRASIPMSPNVMMIDWIEVGKPEATAPAARPQPAPQPRKQAPVRTESRSDSINLRSAAPEAPPTLDDPDDPALSPAAQARKVSLEDYYKAQVWRELQRRKTYPALSRRLGQTGKVVLRFKIDRKGKVLRSELLSRSPHPALNEATEAMLAGIGSFQPIPEELQRISWEFTVPIEYRLE